MRLLRRVRGALGTGLTWAAGWGLLGAVHGFLVGMWKPWQWALYNPVSTTAFGYALAGLIAGTGFSCLLSWMDRRSNLRRLSRFRVAVWGATGGAFVPVLVHLTRGLTSSAGWGDVALTAAAVAVLGSASAVATLWVARRSAPETHDIEPLAEYDLLSSPPPDWSGSFSAQGELADARSRADA